MQAGKGKFHLRLDPYRTNDPAARSALGGVTYQGGLAYPRLTAQHQHRALPHPRIGQQPVQPRTLGFTSGQPSIGVLKRDTGHLLRLDRELTAGDHGHDAYLARTG